MMRLRRWAKRGHLVRIVAILRAIEWVLVVLGTTVVAGPAVLREVVPDVDLMEQIAQDLESYIATIGISVAAAVGILRIIRNALDRERIRRESEKSYLVEQELADNVREILTRVKDVQARIG